MKALREYVLRVKDVRNGKLDDVHGMRLNFYQYGDLDQKMIMSHVLSSETGMPVARLLRLVYQAGEVYVAVRCTSPCALERAIQPQIIRWNLYGVSLRTGRS